MMPVIRISDRTFETLQSLAVPLVDTPSTVIDRLVAEHLASAGLEPPAPEAETPPGIRDFDPTKPPGLTHTKLLSITVDGQAVERLRWSACLIATVAAVAARGHSGQDLIDQLEIPAVLGEETRQGFTPYDALGLSIQGQSAQDAWKEISRLAVAHAIPLTVTFKWRAKQSAHYPGQKGRMTIAA